MLQSVDRLLLINLPQWTWNRMRSLTNWWFSAYHHNVCLVSRQSPIQLVIRPGRGTVINNQYYAVLEKNDKMPCYRKEDRAMHPIYGCSENFRESLTMLMATFADIFIGLLFRSILWMCVQNLKFVPLPVSEIIGGSHKIWTISVYANAPISPKFLMGFCSDGHTTVNIPASAKFEVRIFTRSWDNSDWSFGRGCGPQSSGREGCRGSGMEPFERALMSSYRHSIVTFFSPSLRVSEILTFLVLQHATFPLTDINKKLSYRRETARQLCMST